LNDPASSKTKELQSLIDKRKNILGSNTILCRLQIDLEKRKKQLKSELKSLRRAKKVAERKKRISLANGVDEIEESSSSDDDFV
jgi:vacuolar-type H+-ATPase subunit I/STV1